MYQTGGHLCFSRNTWIEGGSICEIWMKLSFQKSKVFKKLLKLKMIKKEKNLDVFKIFQTLSILGIDRQT